MKKAIPILSLCAALASPLVLSGSAAAQGAAPVVTSTGSGGGAGIGVGAAAFLSGLTALEVGYDQSRWHMEGLFGFNTPNNGATRFDAGVRGWFHLHSGVNSDFSVGGGIGMQHIGSNGNAPSATATLIEPGMQARVFLTPNFALHMTGGLAMVFGDNAVQQTGVRTGQQLSADFGFTYFFR